MTSDLLTSVNGSDTITYMKMDAIAVTLKKYGYHSYLMNTMSTFKVHTSQIPYLLIVTFHGKDSIRILTDI